MRKWNRFLLQLVISLLPLATFGIYDGDCGNWQHNYTLLHEKILKGSLSPRFLVSVPHESGLSDRITGIVTEFLYALITRRAFQVMSRPEVPDLEYGLDSPNVNWTRATDPFYLWEPLLGHYQGKREYGPQVNTSKYWLVYTLGMDEAAIGSMNLKLFPPGHYDAETVFWTGNRGGSIRLFDNPYHARELAGMGLRPEIAFACVFRYLFKPNAEVEKMVAKYLDVLKQPGSFRLGIHIRIGDAVMDGEDHFPKELLNPYFTCANQITKERTYPNQTVTWLFLSDSVAAKKYAIEHYSKVVLTDVERVYHVQCGQSLGVHCHNNTYLRQHAVRLAVAHWLLLSNTDVQIYSQYSSFGRIGAWLSGKWSNLYAINSDSTHAARSCSHWDFDPPHVSAQQWSHI